MNGPEGPPGTARGRQERTGGAARNGPEGPPSKTERAWKDWQGLLIVPFPFRGGTRWGCSLVVHKDVVCQHFTLTPALSLKGEGELKGPGWTAWFFVKVGGIIHNGPICPAKCQRHSEAGRRGRLECESYSLLPTGKTV